jgi:arylsulfatase A-like enzyme
LLERRSTFAVFTAAAVSALLPPSLAACERRDTRPGERRPEPASSVRKSPVSADPSGAPHAASALKASSEASARGRRPNYNVLLLTIDALRADMPWAGYSRPIAPNLTRLAERAVSYTNYRSTASYTAQSVGVMLSGRYVSTLYRTGVFFTGYSTSNHFIAEALSERGVRTAGVHAHRYFDRKKQLDQGFGVWELVPGITFDSETDNNVTSDQHVDLLMKTLSPEFTGGRFFAWAHFGDPHDQYVRHDFCPREWGKSNRDRYDCEVYFVDRELGRFFAWAEQQPWWKDTAVIVSADHGEAFGEHGMWKHAFQLWDVLVRIPALFVVPGATPRRIAEARSHIDLAPTILDLMGAPPLPGFFGRSLVPELFGAPADNREPILLELNEDSHTSPVRALIEGEYKLHVVGSGEGFAFDLYNLKADPGELRDLEETEPAQLERMKALYRQTLAKLPIVEPYGGARLKSGGRAKGPEGPTQAASPGVSAKP